MGDNGSVFSSAGRCPSTRGSQGNVPRSYIKELRDAHQCAPIIRSVKCRRQQRRSGLRWILSTFGQAIVSLRNHQHLSARLLVAHVGYLGPSRFVAPVEPACGERAKLARRGAQILGVVRKHRIRHAVRGRSSPDRRPTDRPTARRRVQEASRSSEFPHGSKPDGTDNFCTRAHDHVGAGLSCRSHKLPLLRFALSDICCSSSGDYSRRKYCLSGVWHCNHKSFHWRPVHPSSGGPTLVLKKRFVNNSNPPRAFY